jgi:hypothetical protein
MSMTRGEFLRSLAVGAGGAVSALTALGAQGAGSSTDADAPANSLSPSERNRQLTERLSKDVFARNLNATFQILDKTSPVVVETRLVDVHEGHSSETHEQFSLLFRGPAEPQLAQCTYEIRHNTIGTFELFLVPIAADANHTSYEAVFNRLRK